MKCMHLYLYVLHTHARARTRTHTWRRKYLEQLAYCHSGFVTVQSRIEETAKDLPVWTTIATPVRLSWRLRNLLTYLLS